MGVPQSARNHLGQPYMYADVLHKTARENTDTEPTHSQGPNDDGATGLCLLVASLPGPTSSVWVPVLHCAAHMLFKSPLWGLSFSLV